MALSFMETFSLEPWLLKVLGAMSLDEGDMLLLIFPNFSKERDKEEVLKTVFSKPFISFDFSSFFPKPGSPSK